MRRPDHEFGPRVFITAFRSFEIVYLPETGQITTRFEGRPAGIRRPKEEAASCGKDGTEDSED